MRSYDNILHEVGPFGRYQIVHWLLLGCATIPAGIHNLLNVFLEATPPYWCDDPGLANITNGTGPSLFESPGQSIEWKCVVPDVDQDSMYSSAANNDTTASVDVTSRRACDKWRYDYDMYGITSVTKWDLVCSKNTFPALAQSIYMFGFLLGAFIFGYTSDRYGRRISLLATVVGLLSTSVISCFMPEFWSHVFLRMLTGASACGAATVTFVMIMEMVGRKKRMVTGLFAQVFFAIGYMMLSWIAFLTRNFFKTNLVMSLLPLPLLCLWWTETESIRWLLTHGKVDEAKKNLALIAKANGREVDTERLLKEYFQNQKVECEATLQSRQYSILDLVKTPNMRKKTAYLLFIWFVCGSMFYGLSMGVTDLAGNPYLNLFLSGVMECLSVFATCMTLNRFGRKISLSAVLFIGGVACLIYGALPQQQEVARTVLSMIGKFGVSGAFAIMYVFSAELYPTLVRTIGVGAGSILARTGALLAPFIGQLKIYWFPLPTVIFGVFALTAGSLAMMLPETLGERLPDTMEEGEDFGKNMPICSCNIPKRSSSGKPTAINEQNGSLMNTPI